jgi:two-component sensor histidine kinase
MKKSSKKPLILDQERLKDKTKLSLTVNYIVAICSLLLFLITNFWLGIESVIPWTFLTYGILTIFLCYFHKNHKNLIFTFYATVILALLGTGIIVMHSGGIYSMYLLLVPFMVLAGFIAGPTHGKIMTVICTTIILGVFILSTPERVQEWNVVPPAAIKTFNLMSLLFSVVIMGVLGNYLIRSHHKLYRLKQEAYSKLHEKETLLKEIHHRVKNNLQTISSLLSLQSNHIEDVQMKALMRSSQNRVISMAMIHEMLYMRDDISNIDYKTYVIELCEYLIRSIVGTESDVKLDLDIDDINLDINTAIPLGLLINEIVTNSLKYGVNENSGEIYISLKKSDDADYELKIGDFGQGYEEDKGHQNTRSLGLKLIHNLARQLKGEMQRDLSRKGTHYVLHFKELKQLHPSG